MIKTILLTTILCLFASTADAAKLIVDLSQYDYDYAKITIFTPYNGVGIKSVNYSTENPEFITQQQQYLNYGPYVNVVEVLKDVEQLNIYVDWSVTQRFTGTPGIDLETFGIRTLLVKDGAETVIEMRHVKPNIFRETNE